jgi:uncharacterized protein (TIGR02246 family)
MIHQGRLRPPSHDYPADEWNLIEKGLHPEFLAQLEMMLALGNGYLGIGDARMPKTAPSSMVIAHTSDLIRKVIIPLFASVLFASMSAAQNATPVVVVDDFLKAWNSHDAKAFDRLFTQDAIWVPVAETRVIGHADVIKQFEQIHTTWAKKTTIIARDIKVQSVRPDVAMILFHAKFVQDAKEVPVLDRAMIMVAVKQADGWRVAAGQVTKQHEGP